MYQLQLLQTSLQTNGTLKTPAWSDPTPPPYQPNPYLSRRPCVALKAATSGPKSSTSGVVCPTCPYTCARQVPPKRASPAPRSTYSNRPVPLSFRSGVTVFVMSGHVQYSWQPSGHHKKKGGEWRGGGGGGFCMPSIYPVYRYLVYKISSI